MAIDQSLYHLSPFLMYRNVVKSWCVVAPFRVVLSPHRVILPLSRFLLSLFFVARYRVNISGRYGSGPSQPPQEMDILLKFQYKAYQLYLSVSRYRNITWQYRFIFISIFRDVLSLCLSCIAILPFCCIAMSCSVTAISCCVVAPFRDLLSPCRVVHLFILVCFEFSRQFFSWFQGTMYYGVSLLHMCLCPETTEWSSTFIYYHSLTVGTWMQNRVAWGTAVPFHSCRHVLRLYIDIIFHVLQLLIHLN